MKKIMVFICASIIALTVGATKANGQNIVTELSKHEYIERITELCEQYENLRYKSDIKSDITVKAVYSKYALKTLEQIGAIYAGTELSDDMNMNAFNIGYDIYTIYNAVVKKIMYGQKNKITDADYLTVKACEKDIYENLLKI